MFWIYAVITLATLGLIGSFVYEYADEIEMMVDEAKEMINRKRDLA